MPVPVTAFILQDPAHALVLSVTLSNGGSPIPNGTVSFHSGNDGSLLGSAAVVNPNGLETKLAAYVAIPQSTHDSVVDSTYYDQTITASYSVGGVTVGVPIAQTLLDSYSATAAMEGVFILDPDGHSVWCCAGGAYDQTYIQKYDLNTKSYVSGFGWPFNPQGPFGEGNMFTIEDGTCILFQDSVGHLYGFSSVHSGFVVGFNNPRDLMRLHKLDPTTFAEVGALGYDDIYPPPSANPINSVLGANGDLDWAIYTRGGADYVATGGARVSFSSSVIQILNLTTMSVVGNYDPSGHPPSGAPHPLAAKSVWVDKFGVVWWACTDGGITSNLYLISWNPADGTTTSPGTPQPPDPWLNGVTFRYTIAGNQWQSGTPNSNFPFVGYVADNHSILVGDIAPGGPTGNESDLASFDLTTGGRNWFQSGSTAPAPFYSGTFDCAYACMGMVKRQPWIGNTNFAMEVANDRSIAPFSDGGIINIIDPTTGTVANTYNLNVMAQTVTTQTSVYTDQGTWSSGAHYNVADIVTGSDGNKYVAKVPSGPGSTANVAIDPAARTSNSPSFNYPHGNAIFWSGLPSFTQRISTQGSFVPAFPPNSNILYVQSMGLIVAATEFVGSVLMVYKLASGPGPFLSDLVTDVCKRSGLDTSTQIDVSQITTIPIRGYLLTNQVDGKTALQNPFAAFFVDAVESDFMLKFVPRGVNGSVLQIPENDLGLENDKAKLTETISQQQELPREVSVLFIDPNIDWQQNKQQKHRSSRVVKTKQTTTMQLPMVFTPTEARAIAEKALYLAYLEGRPFDLNLWKMAYAILDPTDVVQFVYEGHVYQIRLATTQLGVGYTLSLSGVSEEGNTYNSVVTGASAGGIPPNNGVPTTPTVLFLLDVPYLEDSDAVADRSATGYYMGMTASASTWPGGLEFKSDDNTTFDSVDSSTDRMIYGTCANTLGDPPVLWSWDTVNTLTVMLADPTWTLSGTTDVNVLNGANVLVVQKADGSSEVIQYVNAVQNMDGSFTLSRLLRGRRNTEYASTGHGAGETAFDPTTGLKHESSPLVLIGLLRYYRGVTVGQDITAVTSEDFTIQANDLKPASPVHLSGNRDMSGNLTIGWVRRTRYAGDWINGSGAVPLNEDSEQYDIDIYGVSPPGVVRTIHWTPGTYDVNGNPTAVYTAAQQVTDFGSTQAAVALKIYQISAQVGRGFEADATL